MIFSIGGFTLLDRDDRAYENRSSFPGVFARRAGRTKTPVNISDAKCKEKKTTQDQLFN